MGGVATGVPQPRIGDVGNFSIGDRQALRVQTPSNVVRRCVGYFIIVLTLGLGKSGPPS